MRDELRVRALGTIREGLMPYLAHWERPISSTNGARLIALVGGTFEGGRASPGLLRPIFDLVERNGKNASAYRAYGPSLDIGEVESHLYTQNWRSTIVAENGVLGRVALGLRHGATLDDVLRQVAEHYGVEPDKWTKEHGRSGIVVE